MGAAVKTIIARVGLLAERTNAEFVGVRYTLVAELDDSREIADPATNTIIGPRRGLGAIWVRYEGDVTQLDTYDHELARTNPEEAAFNALEQSHRLGLGDVELAISDNPHDDEYEWLNLITELNGIGITVTTETLQAVPWRFEFEPELLVELEFS